MHTITVPLEGRKAFYLNNFCCLWHYVLILSEIIPKTKTSVHCISNYAWSVVVGHRALQNRTARGICKKTKQTQLKRKENNNYRSHFSAKQPTFVWRSSEASARRKHCKSFGRTLATATALACSGVCRPICPSAHAAAACMWSSGSSDRAIASWTTPW